MLSSLLTFRSLALSFVRAFSVSVSDSSGFVE